MISGETYNGNDFWGENNGNNFFYFFFEGGGITGTTFGEKFKI